MVMLVRPLEAAIDAAKAAQAEQGIASTRVVMMSPQGAPLTHERAVRMAQEPGVVVLCGRYEAIDQRLLDRCVDEEISLGDFVLSGGELPAMAMMDAVVRLLPGVLNDSLSAVQDSFADGLLDCPHYTRPEEYDGVRVPDVLLGGHHAEIEWRRQEALKYVAEAAGPDRPGAPRVVEPRRRGVAREPRTRSEGRLLRRLRERELAVPYMRVRRLM